MARLSWALLLLFLVLSLAQEEVEEEVVDLDGGEDEVPTEVDVEPSQTDTTVHGYLEQLSDEELEKICVDRGLALNGDKDTLTREDYLEAAKQCISLEDDINALLNENPDLAAELDQEIERMKASKERLEKEREEILAEKALLEEQLQQAGVDLEEFRRNSTNISAGSMEPPQTALEVLQESFVLLYKRVRQDVEFVGRVLKPILEPAGAGVKLVWRYTKPTLEGVLVKVSAEVKRLKETVMARIKQSKQ